MGALQLTDDVWLVGSGTDPVAFTDPHDCHCYLVWDGEDGFLVDAGTGIGASTWLGNIREVCDPSRLGGVLVTHYHADHAGGAAFASDAGLAVLGHLVTMEALRDGDEEVTQLRRARAAGVYPQDYRLRPARGTALDPDHPATSGDVSMSVLDAPGHCDGHLVYLFDGAAGLTLFSGDCVFAGSRISMQAIPDCRLDTYATTLVRLATHEADVLLPGHGELVLEGAATVVERAAGAFRRLIPPPNILDPW